MAAQWPYGLTGTDARSTRSSARAARPAEARALASKPTVENVQGVKGMKTEIDGPAPRRILFLRVGIDTGCGRALGPLFADGSFEYVPIPEPAHLVGGRGKRFHDLPARSGGSLARFVPVRYRAGYAHHDPEFGTCTYGDSGRTKRAQLLRLGGGDLLVFYAGLRRTGEDAADALHVIGYFTVKAVHRIGEELVRPQVDLTHLAANAHLLRLRPDPGLVIVEGEPGRSRLLERAAQLSDKARNVLPELVGVLGFRGSVKRAVGRWVPEANLRATARWLWGLQ